MRKVCSKNGSMDLCEEEGPHERILLTVLTIRGTKPRSLGSFRAATPA